jgi:hypothetical protein
MTGSDEGIQLVGIVLWREALLPGGIWIDPGQEILSL